MTKIEQFEISRYLKGYDSLFDVPSAITEYSRVSLDQEILGSDDYSDVDEGKNSQEAGEIDWWGKVKIIIYNKHVYL